MKECRKEGTLEKVSWKACTSRHSNATRDIESHLVALSLNDGERPSMRARKDSSRVLGTHATCSRRINDFARATIGK